MYFWKVYTSLPSLIQVCTPPYVFFICKLCPTLFVHLFSMGCGISFFSSFFNPDSLSCVLVRIAVHVYDIPENVIPPTTEQKEYNHSGSNLSLVNLEQVYRESIFLIAKLKNLTVIGSVVFGFPETSTQSHSNSNRN